jgi:hypothetical protein
MPRRQEPFFTKGVALVLGFWLAFVCVASIGHPNGWHFVFFCLSVPPIYVTCVLAFSKRRVPPEIQGILLYGVTVAFVAHGYLFSRPDWYLQFEGYAPNGTVMGKEAKIVISSNCISPSFEWVPKRPEYISANWTKFFVIPSSPVEISFLIRVRCKNNALSTAQGYIISPAPASIVKQRTEEDWMEYYMSSSVGANARKLLSVPRFDPASWATQLFSFSSLSPFHLQSSLAA